MNKKRNLMILFFLVITLFTISIVPKEFQNDTFFNIAVGKYILSNGIDMQEHWSFVSGLTYTYSHWAFDIVMYLIYNSFGFLGIYIFTILFAIITNLTLFTLLSKRSKSPVIACFVTLISAYVIKDCYTARSQIISFICFILEIYCIEEFIETNKKKYAISLVILSIIVANFHAATWPLFLILFLPYVACDVLNYFSFEKINIRKLNKYKKKITNYAEDSEDYKFYKEKIEHIENKLNKNEEEKMDYCKIESKDSYNFKNLIILMVIILFSGLLTPTRLTPYTYIINSMFGKSNFGSVKSMSYIMEMKPLVPANTLSVLVFTILFVAFLLFLPCKLKAEHGFLVVGLYFMAISSCRYSYLLIFLGSYALCDIITKNINLLIPEDIKDLEKSLTLKKVSAAVLFVTLLPTVSSFISNYTIDFASERTYPIATVKYIKNNLDYENMRIYNSYNYGSYLMLHDIPVFIDSRLDVYCSEFNDTDVFKDYIYVSDGISHYDEIFEKYNFTHILLYHNEILNQYLPKDPNYKVIYEDDYFSLYERML